MKKALLLFCCGLLAITATAQVDTLTPKEILISKVYLLDSSYSPSYKVARFKVDDTANFLVFKNGEAVLTGQVRGFKFYFAGRVNGVKSKKDGSDYYTYCYLNLGTVSGTSGTLTIEIHPQSPGKVLLHVYQRLGSYDHIFIAHEGTMNDMSMQPYVKR